MRKIALIGYGYWGRRLLKYLEERFDVAYICHRDAKESGRFTSSIGKVLNSDLEAVVIATPVDTHYEIAKQALEGGKHILCEKPLALSLREVNELSELASGRGLSLVTEFTYTFSNGIREAKRLIDSGEIGNLLSMNLSLGYLGRFLQFDAFWLLASHLLAVRDMFVPLEQNEFSVIEQIPNETGLILIKGPVPGHMSVSLNYPRRESRVTWYGSRGTIVYDGLGQVSLGVAQYKKREGALAPEMMENVQSLSFDEQNNLRNAVGFFASVLDGTDDPKPNLKTAIGVTRILEGHH